MNLEKHVRHLDACINGVVTFATVHARPRGKQFDAAFALRCLLVARGLRKQGSLTTTVEKVLGCLPLALRPLAQSCMSAGIVDLPSQTTLQRHQLVLDVGLMLWRRHHVSTQTCSQIWFG